MCVYVCKCVCVIFVYVYMYLCICKYVYTIIDKNPMKLLGASMDVSHACHIDP